MIVKRGITLIPIVFIVLVVLLLGVSVLGRVAVESDIATKANYSSSAFYVCEAGLEYYLNQLSGDADWSSPPSAESKAFGSGHFAIATSNPSPSQISVEVTGLCTFEGQTYERKVRATIGLVGGTGEAAGEYAIYWSGEGDDEGLTEISNSVTVNGNVYVNSNIDLGKNTVIDGNLFASGLISGDTSGITGVFEEGVEPPSAPLSLDTSFYENELDLALAEPAGDVVYSSQVVSLADETVYINGNLSLLGNSVITVEGSATMVVTGNVTLGNNVVIDNDFTMIAGGSVLLDNNINIGGNNVWYSGLGFTMENNVAVGRDLPNQGASFLTLGDVTVMNSAANFFGLIFANGVVTVGNDNELSGNMVVGNLQGIGGDTQIGYDPYLVVYENVPGISGSMVDIQAGGSVTMILAWDEVY